MLEKTVNRMRKEITNLKQLRQRSASAISTLTKQSTANFTLDNTGYGSATFKVVNLSGSPMLLDVVVDFDNIKQEFGTIYNQVWYILVEDSNNPLNYYLHIQSQSSDDVSSGRSVSIPFSVIGTAGFNLESV